MNANQRKHLAKLEEWRARVSECRASGIPVKSWCRDNHVDSSTYYRWERKVLDKARNIEPAESDKALILSETNELVDIAEANLSFRQRADILSPNAVFQPVAVVKIGDAEISLSNDVSENLIRQLKGFMSYAE